MYNINDGDMNRSNMLKSKRDGNDYICSIKRIGLEYLNEVLDLQRTVTDSMINGAYCLPSSTKDWKRMLQDEGYVLGAFVENRLIAYRALLFPGKNADNLGRHLDFSEEKLDKVFHLELAHVHPDFQGNRLQITMTQLLIDNLKKGGRWKYLLSTVYPFNYPSIKDKFSARMLIVELAEMYSGVWRYLFLSDIMEPIEFDIDDLKTAKIDDFKTQIELLEKGYYGYDLEKEDKTIKGIKFVKGIKKLDVLGAVNNEK